MEKQEYPWEEIQAKYEGGGWTYAALGRAYGLTAARIGQKARQEGWKRPSGGGKPKKPMAACLAVAARQLSLAVAETVRQGGEDGSVSVKELKELTAMLRELVNLQQTLESKEKDSAKCIHIVMDEDAALWSR